MRSASRGLRGSWRASQGFTHAGDVPRSSSTAKRRPPMPSSALWNQCWTFSAH